MELEGSCACGLVKFSIRSTTPYPYQACYCNACRKTTGASGAAVNVMGRLDCMRIEGQEHLRMWAQILDDPAQPGQKIHSSYQRHFCSVCGSHLWSFSPRWPKWVYPVAGCIDTPLPKPPARNHLMLDFKASWVDVPPASATDAHFPRYPDSGIAEWHRKFGLTVEDKSAPEGCDGSGGGGGAGGDDNGDDDDDND